MEKFKIWIVLGFFLICLTQLDLRYKTAQRKIEDKPISKNQSEIFGILTIPSLQLKKEIYPFQHPNNTVQYGIELLKETISQNSKNNFIVLAAHSGNGPHAYFNELEKLMKHDVITFQYQNQELEYQFFQKELVDKIGVIDINHYQESFLVLITCSKKYANKQEVYYAKLVKKSENLLQID